MILCICAFTDRGRELAAKMERELKEDVFILRNKEIPLQDWVRDCFEKRLPILFIGACGIAVRSIAPFVRDKLHDSPVLVIDEAGQFVIPILSGHVGGANFLANRIAEKIHAQAVITTATDVNGKFAVDVFAAENGFHIVNRDGIAKVSTKLLRKESVSVFIDDDIVFQKEEMPSELKLSDSMSADLVIITEKTYLETTRQSLFSVEGHKPLLTLVAKEYILGIGCKKGKAFEEIRRTLEEKCEIDLERQLLGIASIDLKKREPGLLHVSQYYHVPLTTYSAEELMEIAGDFSSSEFVYQTTGADNICERAAVLRSGGDYRSLIVKKVSRDGMTFALAKCKPTISRWQQQEWRFV